MDVWFRLRHLQSLRCRNLNILKRDFKGSLFFALSTADSENIGYFYKSSQTSNLLNPDWEDIDLSLDSVKTFSYLNNFIITYFLSKNGKNKIVMEINIRISGLKESFHQHNNDRPRYLLQFNGRWYEAVDPNKLGSPKIPVSELQRIPPSRNKSSKPVYSKEIINRFLQLIVSNEQKQHMEIKIQKRRIVEQKIFQIKTNFCHASQQQSRLANLRSLIQQLQCNRNQKQVALKDLQDNYVNMDQKMSRLETNFEKTDVEIARDITYLRRITDSYDRTSQYYMVRMYELIKDLARIFPITPTVISSYSSAQTTSVNESAGCHPGVITIKSSDKLSICDLHLPNSDRQILLNQDANTLAALGMVFRLLEALSRIYDIPLRYPLLSETARLMIRDDIIEIDDNERNFHLAKNTSASFKLQYAIYLLNLDVCAIRGYLGLSTPHPERTLWNINTLIEGKSKTVIPSSPQLQRHHKTSGVVAISNSSSNSNIGNHGRDRAAVSTPLSPLVTSTDQKLHQNNHAQSAGRPRFDLG